MPTTLKLKTRRGIGSRFSGPLMKAAMREELNKVKSTILVEFEEVVANWERQPKFEARLFTNNPKNASMSIVVTGSKHATKTWEMLDSKGRKGGKKIWRKNPRYSERTRKDGSPYLVTDWMLHFREWQPKTFPVGQFGWEGKRVGGWMSRKVITQGKIDPRYFSRTIMEKTAKGEFRKAARRGYRNFFNKLTKGPKI